MLIWKAGLSSRGLVRAQKGVPGERKGKGSGFRRRLLELKEVEKAAGIHYPCRRSKGPRNGGSTGTESRKRRMEEEKGGPKKTEKGMRDLDAKFSYKNEGKRGGVELFYQCVPRSLRRKK